MSGDPAISPVVPMILLSVVMAPGVAITELVAIGEDRRPGPTIPELRSPGPTIPEFKSPGDKTPEFRRTAAWAAATTPKKSTIWNNR